MGRVPCTPVQSASLLLSLILEGAPIKHAFMLQTSLRSEHLKPPYFPEMARLLFFFLEYSFLAYLSKHGCIGVAASRPRPTSYSSSAGYFEDAASSHQPSQTHLVEAT